MSTNAAEQGAKKVFGSGGLYVALLSAFPIGFAFPIIYYYLTKKLPTGHWLHQIHPVVIFTGGHLWSPVGFPSCSYRHLMPVRRLPHDTCTDLNLMNPVQPCLHLAGGNPRLAVDGVYSTALGGFLGEVQLRCVRRSIHWYRYRSRLHFLRGIISWVRDQLVGQRCRHRM